MIYKSNDVVFICGKRGSGKSVLAINTFFKKLNRVILHDRKYEHMGHKAVYIHTLEEARWCFKNNKKKLIYQPANNSIEDFNSLCEMIFKHGNTVLIVDEAASYTTSQNIPYYYSELLRLGRTLNIGVISLSQRPNYIHNNCISEANLIFGFKLELKGDRDKVAGTAGPEALKLNEIPPHHYMLYDAYEGVTWHKPIIR